MTDLLTPVIRALNKGMGPALPAIWSPHPDVIASALRQAQAHDLPALIEADTTEINQFGGLSGMTPADFAGFVRDIAQKYGLSDVPLILGAGPLGPQPWRDLHADAAMAHAAQMTADFAAAGFTKLHLDCAAGCADEPGQVGDDVAAGRAARLAAVAEAHAPDRAMLCYVIGSAEPAAGAVRAPDGQIPPTPPERVLAILAAHEAGFVAAGLNDAWSRLRAVVVQPGLGFSDAQIHRFDIQSPNALSPALGENERLCFQIHAMDYQPQSVHAELARRNAAIIRIGPALTFAWREAIYALSHVRHWLDGSPHISGLIDELMRDDPRHVESPGADNTEARLTRHFGYADDIRHYWHSAQTEVDALCAALDARSIPQTLLLQYLSRATLKRASRLDLPPARAILQAHVEEAMERCYPDEAL